MSSQEPPTYSESCSNQQANLSSTNDQSNPTVQATTNSATPYSTNNVELGCVEAQINPKYGIRFNDASIRTGFIRKVLFLVTIMLGVVAIMSAIPFFNHDLKKKVQDTPALYYASYGAFLVVYFILICCPGISRHFPSNLICTGILTLSIGYMTMMITSMYDVECVLLTFAITAIVCATVILFAIQTKYDLTSMIGFLFIASMCVFVIGIVAVISIVVFKVRWLYTIYAGIASLLFMFYLAFDIQMMVGGKKYAYDPEDYIVAAIQIFLDIINLFWLILSIIGCSRN
uniref:Uncharacterized protein n=1 Tax=Panagrolaimus sp. JU765 TaxID=591449 RepID=A0AC34RQF8_9BILA